MFLRIVIFQPSQKRTVTTPTQLHLILSLTWKWVCKPPCPTHRNSTVASKNLNVWIAENFINVIVWTCRFQSRHLVSLAHGHSRVWYQGATSALRCTLSLMSAHECSSAWLKNKQKMLSFKMTSPYCFDNISVNFSLNNETSWGWTVQSSGQA